MISIGAVRKPDAACNQITEHTWNLGCGGAATTTRPRMSSRKCHSQQECVASLGVGGRLGDACDVEDSSCQLVAILFKCTLDVCCLVLSLHEQACAVRRRSESLDACLRRRTIRHACWSPQCCATYLILQLQVFRCGRRGLEVPADRSTCCCWKKLQALAVPQAMREYPLRVHQSRCTHLCRCDAQCQQQHCDCALHAAVVSCSGVVNG